MGARKGARKKKLSKQLHALKKQKGCKKRRLKKQTSRFIRKKRSNEPSNKHNKH